MGVLASTQRVPLPPFQQYQEWRLSDVQLLLSRFEKDPRSFGFKIDYRTYQGLVQDLPVPERSDDDEPTPHAPPHRRTSIQRTGTTARQTQRQAGVNGASHLAQAGLTLPPIHSPPSSSPNQSPRHAPVHTPRAHHASSDEKESTVTLDTLTPAAPSSFRPHPPATGAPSHTPAPPPHPPTRPTINTASPSVSFHSPRPSPIVPTTATTATMAPSTTSSPAPLLSSEVLFNIWVGPDLKDDDRLDLLVFVGGIICMCRARYVAKMRALFRLFDFDEDGILNRQELSALVRGVAVALHRIYGVGIINPPTFVFHSHDGVDRSLGTVSHVVREPNAKQCERWNEQHVRRFEPALRSGAWNLDGFLEWAAASTLAAHLLGTGMRTRSGETTTIDAARVQARLFDAQQRMQPVNNGSAVVGASAQFVRAASRHSSRDEEMLHLALQQERNTPAVTAAATSATTPRTSRPSPPSVNGTTSGSSAKELASTPRSSTAPATSPSAASLGKSGSVAGSLSLLGSSSSTGGPPTRFKFAGQTSAREVKNLKKLFDDMDIDSSGHLSLDYLRKPKKYTDPFLLRDITSVFQEWKGPIVNDATGGGTTNSHAHVTEVSFSELLDVLYQDLTPEDHKLLHSWIPAPINKESVKALQSIFDRLDTDFTGKVKFSKVMHAFRTEHATNEAYQKLMEPFSRLRPHRLEIAVNIRELLTALFNRTHPKQLKKILNWSRPTKPLTIEQQNELIRLFDRYDTRNEGRFPIANLKHHLLERGLPPAEIEKMMEDIHVYTEAELQAASESAAAAHQSKTTSTTPLPPASHADLNMTTNTTSNSTATSSLNATSTFAATIPIVPAVDSAANVAAVSGPASSSSPSSDFTYPPTPEVVPPDEPMITLQEFQLFYRDMWDSSNEEVPRFFLTGENPRLIHGGGVDWRGR